MASIPIGTYNCHQYVQSFFGRCKHVKQKMNAYIRLLYCAYTAAALYISISIISQYCAPMSNDRQQNGHTPRGPEVPQLGGIVSYAGGYMGGVNYTSCASRGMHQNRYVAPQQLTHICSATMQMPMHPQQYNITPPPLMFRSRSFSPPMISPMAPSSAPPSARSSPQSPGSPFNEHICVDCLHGLCDGNCGKRHPNNLIQTKAEMDKKKTTILCFYFAHAKCSKSDCAFLHVNTHEASYDGVGPCTQDKACGTNDNVNINVDFILRSIKALGAIGDTNAVMRIQKEAEDVWLSHVDAVTPADTAM